MSYLSKSRCIFVSTATQTIQNTIVETTQFGTGIGSTTIKAKSLSPGDTIEIRTQVRLSCLNGQQSTFRINDGGFVVYETGAPSTTYAVSAIAPNGGNHNQIDLTVADIISSAATGVTVTYVQGGNGTVADTTGNLLETDSTGQNVNPWA